MNYVEKAVARLLEQNETVINARIITAKAFNKVSKTTGKEYTQVVLNLDTVDEPVFVFLSEIKLALKLHDNPFVSVVANTELSDTKLLGLIVKQRIRLISQTTKEGDVYTDWLTGETVEDERHAEQDTVNWHVAAVDANEAIAEALYFAM